jgi:GntR family transcriptional repressor for pyruvate dehydrogenase complex
VAGRFVGYGEADRCMHSSSIKRYGLANQVIERVRALVADGTYRVGDRLPPEQELCAMFGVGRSTVREAMGVLANRGLVDVRHGEGTFVAARALRESFEERLGGAALADIYEARLFLELPLAELAAQRRDARDVTAMRSCLKKRERAIRAGDVERYGEADFGFHLAVARAAKSPALLDVYESFVQTARSLMKASVTPEYLRTEKDLLHDELCEAIARGDVAKTRRLVRSHLNKSLRDLSTGLD